MNRWNGGEAHWNPDAPNVLPTKKHGEHSSRYGEECGDAKHENIRTLRHGYNGFFTPIIHSLFVGAGSFEKMITKKPTNGL